MNVITVRPTSQRRTRESWPPVGLCYGRLSSNDGLGSVAYTACYHCELLFEVDDVPTEPAMPCPQCGQALDPYEPDPEAAPGLDSEPPPPSILATQTFGDLAQSVRDKLAVAPPPAAVPRANAAVSRANAAVPRANAAVPRANAVVDLSPPGAARGGQRGTKVLDIHAAQSELDALAAGAMEETGLSPAVPARSATLTPPPVKRAEAPLALEPIGGSRAQRSIGPPSTPPIGPPSAPPIGPPHETGHAPSASELPPRKSRLPMIIGGLGALAMLGMVTAFFLRRGGDGVPAPASAAGPPSAAATQGVGLLSQSLADALAELPEARVGLEIDPAMPWLAAGPEGLSTSFGAVPGVPAITVPSAQVEKTAGGSEFVRPLKTLLVAHDAQGPRLLFALDKNADARTLMRFAAAGHEAGFRKPALAISRDGSPAMLPFEVYDPTTPPPSTGLVQISIGSLTLKADALDAQGAVQSFGTPIRHKDPGAKPDLDALTTRLDSLKVSNADVKRAVVWANPEMTVTDLARVLERVYSGGGKARFAEIALAIR